MIYNNQGSGKGEGEERCLKTLLLLIQIKALRNRNINKTFVSVAKIVLVNNAVHGLWNMTSQVHKQLTGKMKEDTTCPRNSLP